MNDARDFDLSTLLAEVRRRAVLIVLCTLAAAGAAYVGAQQLGDRYEASAELLFEEANPSAPERTAATNLALASLDSVVFRVRKRLGIDAPVDTLRKRISLEPRGQADIVKVTARAGSAKAAARLANVFAEEVVKMRRERAQLAVQRQIDVLDGRIAEAAADPNALASLNPRRQKLTVDKALATGDVEIADPALPPLERSSPKPLRYALLSGLLAFLLAVAAAVLARTVKRRVDEKDVSAIFGSPILARVPTRRRSAWREQLYQEAFQFLRANVATVTRVPSDSRQQGGHRGRMIAVTSPLPGNGKSTVVAGLSDALALAGNTVLAVDCDLRKPSLSEEFGLLPGTDGLPEALLGHFAAEDLLVATSIPSVSLLPGGQAGANFAVAHATARRLPEVLNGLRKIADVVLVDTAPVALAAETSIVTSIADDVIVVIDARDLRRDALEETRDQLDRSGANVLGVVLNRTEFSEDKALKSAYGRPYRRPKWTGHADPSEAEPGTVEPETVQPEPRAGSSVN